MQGQNDSVFAVIMTSYRLCLAFERARQSKAGRPIGEMEDRLIVSSDVGANGSETRSGNAKVIKEICGGLLPASHQGKDFPHPVLKSRLERFHKPSKFAKVQPKQLDLEDCFFCFFLMRCNLNLRAQLRFEVNSKY